MSVLPSALRPAEVDTRAPRFTAWVSTVVLAVVLLTQSGWLLAAQTAVFALGAFVGLGAAPYGLLYRKLVAPRLAPPRDREASAPVRFAQGVGFAFCLVGTVSYLAGAPLLGAVATGLALIAAFLNAAFGLCLGCMMYLRGRLLVHQLTRGRRAEGEVAAPLSPVTPLTDRFTRKGASA